MHLELPLERRRGRAAQLSFATEAMDRLPQRTDYALTPSPLGLHLLGRDEDALEAPIEALPRYEARVRKAMARRGAKASAEFERLLSLMRYEAPLANLLGLGDELGRLTKGTARHWMALSHYTHVKRRKETK